MFYGRLRLKKLIKEIRSCTCSIIHFQFPSKIRMGILSRLSYNIADVNMDNFQSTTLYDRSVFYVTDACELFKANGEDV